LFPTTHRKANRAEAHQHHRPSCRLSMVDEYGRTISDSDCSNPCRVVKTFNGYSVERRQFTPASVIGAAFEDALNGRLKVTRDPRFDVPVA
jgi:hypothetical protein